MAIVTVRHRCGHVVTHNVPKADAKRFRLRAQHLDCPACWSDDDDPDTPRLSNYLPDPADDGKGGGR